MAVGVKRVQVSTDQEQQLVTGLVVSTEFCRKVLPVTRLDHVKDPQSRRVLSWVKDYFKRYDKAPGREVQTLFELERPHLSETESGLLERYLHTLSTKYEETERHNWDFQADLSRDYLRARDLEDLEEKVRVLRERGDLVKAETLVRDFTKTGSLASDFTKPFLDKQLQQQVMERKDAGLFKMPGAVGEIFGWWQRGWLVSFFGPMKRGKCLSASTPILLADGRVKTIEQVVLDRDRDVVTFDERAGKLKPTRVSKHHNNGEKPTVVLTTRTGRRITTTKSHPYLTVQGWKPVGDLSLGQRIAVPRQLPFFGGGEISQHKIRLLAYLLAEGGFTGTQITFTKKSLLVLKDFQSCAAVMGDSLRTAKDGATHGIRGGNIRRWLNELGIKHEHSRDKFIPDLVFTLSKHCLAEFLSVLFDCDGSIESSGTISYSSASETLARQVQHLLLRFGVVGRLYSKWVKGRKYWAITVRDSENFHRFMAEIGFGIEKTGKAQSVQTRRKSPPINRGFLDSFPLEYLQKKVVKEIEMFKLQGGKPWRDVASYGSLEQALRLGGSLSRSTLKNIANSLDSKQLTTDTESDILWDEVVSIEPGPKEYTYDLTVPRTHCFVAADILAHNSWWLGEVAIEAMSQGLKVLFISLEMGKEDLSKRFYQRALALPDKSGPVRIPCWDCASNQDGTCQLVHRKNQEPIPVDLEGTPRYSEDSPYLPCAHCKTDAKNLQHYRIASWFQTIHKREGLFQNMVRRLKAFALGYHGGNLELKCYPRFGGTVEDIESDLETLAGNGFLVDVLVVDYAGIIASKGDRLDQLDHIWKNLAKIASKRKLLLVTASQGTRDAIKSRSMDMTQTAEDIRIMAHIDLGISLNQITETKRGKINEREQMLLRLGAMAVRHGHTPNDEVFVLQNLDLGQPAMDTWAVSAGHRLLGSKEEAPVNQPHSSWR